MNDEAIVAGIQQFPRWHYQFDLRGHLTPIHDPTRVNRHEQRKRYFFDPLVELVGGSLEGKRVLDLGCNAGFWALHSVNSGCDHVFGIDGRETHIDQANFVFEALNVEPGRYEFATGNVFDVDLARHGPYDVVLLLGLLYHVAKPVELIELASAVCSDLLVIDTRVLERTEAVFEVVSEGLSDPRNAIEYGVVMRPSSSAVAAVARMLGFDVAMLKPQFMDYGGAPDYATGLRKAFLCAKSTDLSGLAAITQPLPG